VLTPDHLRRRAAALERQAAKLRTEADAIEAAIRRTLEENGPSVASSCSIETMLLQIPEESSKMLRQGAGRIRRDHPAIRAWYAAGKTVSAIAAEVGVKRQSVNAWLAPAGPRSRGIPLAFVQRFEREYGIPASAWTRITP
jgi:hypothetical protein